MGVAWARLASRRSNWRETDHVVDGAWSRERPLAAQQDDQPVSARRISTSGTRDEALGKTVFSRIGLPMLVACAVALALTAVAAVISATSPIVDRPALYVTFRTVLCVGLVTVAVVALTRSVSERMSALLIAAAIGFALTGLTAANSSIPFVIGRIAIPLTILVTTYACFAYPSGKLEDRAASILWKASAVAMTVLLAANLLLSHIHPVGGPFVRCVGRRCPQNPINVISLGSGPSNALSIALALVTAGSMFGVAVLVGRRAARASPLQRRSLGALLAWVVLAAVGYGFFVAARAVDQHAHLLTPTAAVVAGIIAAMPFAIALGMARGRVFAMEGLERMVAELGEHLTLPELQRNMSRAFDDPRLRLLVWRPAVQHYLDVHGRPIELSGIGSTIAITHFDRDGKTVAAAVHDPGLSEDVLEAAGSAVRLALDNARLETQLQASVRELEASRKRVARAADEERRRIEQDLHDGAQQGLIALRIKLQLLEELAADNPEAVAPGLADAGKRVDAALNDIRNLAQGIYPSVLRDLGLSYALVPVARELPIEVALQVEVTRRFAPEVETAVYFCCVEALQNVAKHCGADVRARVFITEEADGLDFAVLDNGLGFDPALFSDAHGFTGMHDRLEAVGGELTISSSSGQGTAVTGRVPASVL